MQCIDLRRWIWVSREKTVIKKNAEDYFLASKSLPWLLVPH
jgi:hypothetical protein